MTDTAQIRRSPWLRRIFLPLPKVRLEPPRQRSDGFVHLSGVTETSHAIPGLEAVLTTSELAAHLGVKVQTMRDLLHARRGPCGFRVGREMRYQVSEVQYWVETLEFQDQAAPLADLAGSTA